MDFAGAIHHLYQRGNNKQAIFLDDDDRAFFLNYLARLKLECGFKLYALCLMTNHFHWLIETGLVPLKEIMSRFETAYVMRFNEKHKRVGHLFQGRYQAKLCSRDAYFLRLVRYIHRNPVRAGLVEKCGEWKWSGHQALALGRSGLIDADFPLSFFGDDKEAACAAYRAYVDDAVDDAWDPEAADLARLDAADQLADLLRTAADIHGCSAAEVASGSKAKTLTAAKRAFISRGLDAGFTQAQLARALRCSEAAVAWLRRNSPKT